MSSNEYNNKVVIITGASSGIGEELARQLARQNAKLVLAARNIDHLKRISDECLDIGAEATYLRTDVTNRNDCELLVRHAVDSFGRIDVLVNNAGLSMWTTLEDLSNVEILNYIMAVNFFGSVYCTYYALKHLKSSKGQIVVINSEAGKTGVPTRTGYSASKYALNGFFNSLRIELDGSGVSITSIYPGFVATGAHERVLGADGTPLGAKHPVDYANVMTTETCVNYVIKGMIKRKREVLISARIKWAAWLNLIAPSLVDRFAYMAIQKGR